MTIFLEQTAETECYLYLPGCNDLYQGSEIVIEDFSPYAVKTKRNKIEGFNETICYACQGSDSFKTYDDINIVQKPATKE